MVDLRGDDVGWDVVCSGILGCRVGVVWLFGFYGDFVLCSVGVGGGMFCFWVGRWLYIGFSFWFLFSDFSVGIKVFVE